MSETDRYRKKIKSIGVISITLPVCRYGLFNTEKFSTRHQNQTHLNKSKNKQNPTAIGRTKTAWHWKSKVLRVLQPGNQAHTRCSSLDQVPMLSSPANITCIGRLILEDSRLLTCKSDSVLRRSICPDKLSYMRRFFVWTYFFLTYNNVEQTTHFSMT